MKPSVLEHSKSGQKLVDIDLSNNQNLIYVGKIKAGLEVTGTINKLKADIMNFVQIKDCMKGIQQFVIGMVKKLFEREVRWDHLFCRSQICLIQMCCCNYQNKHKLIVLK